MIISGDDIEKVRLGLASPEEIRSWSQGEVTESETINYRTHRPERGGLFAEEIFGPEKDYECACGKYRGRKFEGIVCEKCGVLVTDSSVRRSNMGHIELASPVVHFWFLKGISSPLSTLLGIKRNVLKKIAYYETEPRQEELYLVTSSDCELKVGDILYGSQVEILAQKKSFVAESAYQVTQAPEIRTEAGGLVILEKMKLENGEELLIIKVGDKQYPVSPGATLQVKEGDEVEEGDLLAASPVGDEIISETKYNLFKALYPIKGIKASEVVDSLIFLITKVKKEGFPLKVGAMLHEPEKAAYELAYKGEFEAHTGALGIKGLLENLDLDNLATQLRQELAAEESEGKQKRIIKRLEIVEQLRRSGNRPQDMVLEVLPVLPPELRPIVQLEGGKFATTDLNDLYRRIINRNNRLKKLLEMGAPEVILRNERRMLQEAVDALIHNEKKDNPILGRDNRPLKSLSERIQGKHGRLRRNLLGKRVDYSGRAVIVVNPKLKLNQCGIPKKLALELFKPFILQRLGNRALANFDEVKNKALSGQMPEVWDILEQLVKEHPVLLNRAPTLHRLGIQAFEPILVDGEAIQIHPFVCPPYAADFDGDQMAVHLPLSKEAIWEAREILLAPRNILSPASGMPLSIPTQDLVFAFYYLTVENPEGKGKDKYFASLSEAERAYEEGIIELHSPIKIRIEGQILETTLGRLKLNLLFPEDLRDYKAIFNADTIERVIMECYHRYGNERTVKLLDDLKELGFSVATKSGLTISVKDCLISPEKERILEEAYARVKKINEMYARGMATAEERSSKVIDVWMETVDKVEKVTMRNFSQYKLNPVYAIVQSGARGSANQVKQLAGMRGPMTDPAGRIIEMPVVSNFREGLNEMEYFISTHGGRKGTADTALKTADSGYLTRRLVDATEELIIKEEDCGTGSGIEIDPLYYGKGEIMEGIAERIYGRVAAQTISYDGQVLLERGELISREKAQKLSKLEFEVRTSEKNFLEKVVGMKSLADIRDPRTQTVIVMENEVISSYLGERIKESGVKSIRVRPAISIRSPLTCETKRGVCQLCYGIDLSTHKLVALGTAVGVIAAQSIGEPGTQLTMRTFHTGGVVGEDITQGLPRAEELFEARKATKGTQGVIAPISGNITAIETTPTGKQRINIRGEGKKIRIPKELCQVKEGDRLKVREIISSKSPTKGEIRIVSEGGFKKLYILNLEDSDRIYQLPQGIRSILRSGQWVEKGAPITEPFNEEPVVAKEDGIVEEIVEDGERFLIIKDEEGRRIKHRIPHGARKQVEVGDRVMKGAKLSTRSSPTTLVAQNSGVAVVQDGRVLIYQPDKKKEFILTEDILLLKEEGSEVKEGEELFALNLPQGETVVIDALQEIEGHLLEVHFHYESTVELPPQQKCVAHVGDKVKEGDLLSKGVISPHLLLKVAGVQRTRDYLLTEIHKVYKSQGVDINDKHIELVIRQMLNNVRIKDPGDSGFPNGLVLLEEFKETVEKMTRQNREIRRNREEILGSVLLEDVMGKEGVIAKKGEELTADILRAILAAGITEVTVDREGAQRVRIGELKLPVGERVLLRISKSALETKSFLSAASFQRTTTVLAEAALKGAVDSLEGLKPNIIVSKKIPAGTGFRRNE